MMPDFIRSKHFLCAAVFTLGFFFAEVARFVNYDENIALRHYFQAGRLIAPLVLIALTAATLAITACFVWLAVSSPYRHRIAYFVLFCLAVLTEYGYQKAFNRFTNIEDAENALIATDLRIKLDAVEMYFDYTALVSCLCFALLLIFLKPTINRSAPLFFAALVLVSAIFFTFTAYFTSNAFHITSFAAFYRTALDFPVDWHLGSVKQEPVTRVYRAPRYPVLFQAAAPPTNNIVLIIDESVRGDHLSINGYPRPTTPFLESLLERGLVKNWGVVAAGATCSKASNNLLLTGISELPDREFNVYRYPTIFQYAKAMGYKNYYFDAQVSHVWNGKPLDVPDYGEWTTGGAFKDLPPSEVDAEIARRVRRIVAGSIGNFIWINKFGLHKPFDDSYPEAEIVWPTSLKDDEEMSYSAGIDREQLKNSYDNGIRYNSDRFFRALLGEEVPENTLFLYTSDHGVSLMENNEAVSHCSNTRNEAAVPLLAISARHAMPDFDTGYKASHANIFATLLDLMNFPEESRPVRYKISLLKATPADAERRRFYAGDLHGRGNGSYHWFDD